MSLKEIASSSRNSCRQLKFPNGHFKFFFLLLLQCHFYLFTFFFKFNKKPSFKKNTHCACCIWVRWLTVLEKKTLQKYFNWALPENRLRTITHQLHQNACLSHFHDAAVSHFIQCDQHVQTVRFESSIDLLFLSVISFRGHWYCLKRLKKTHTHYFQPDREREKKSVTTLV